MNPIRFDRLSKRIGAGRVSRRGAVRGIGAIGIAGALFGLGRQPAAADCPDINSCRGWCGPDYLCHPPRFRIPGGPYGTCWDWSAFTCKPCSGKTMAEMDAICNQAKPECGGECHAY